MPRHRHIIWLFSFCAVVAITYACSPWLIRTLITNKLSSLGINNAQFQVSYPGWQDIHLSAISIQTTAGNYQVSTQVKDINVTYQVSKLFTGKLTRIHIPEIIVKIEPAITSSQTVNSSSELPLTTVASGQWLTSLPIEHLQLDRVITDIYSATDQQYSIQLAGKLSDRQLHIKGTMTAPFPPKTIMISFTAQHTGESRLILTGSENNATPIIDLNVQSVTRNGDNIIMQGNTRVQATKLYSMVTPERGSAWLSQLADEIRGEWTGRFSSSPYTININSALHTVKHGITLQLNALYQPASNRTTADFKLLPVNFNQSDQALSQLVSDWPYPFDITGGRMSARGHLDWQQKLQGQGVLLLEGLKGHYNKITFSGLDARVPLFLKEGIRTHEEATLQVNQVDVGFPVNKTDISFSLAKNSRQALPILHIREWTAHMLGGTASGNDFELNFNRDKNNMVVKVTNLALDEIIQLEQQEELQASGVLDGQIPLEITGKELAVKHGRLSARAPGGFIRYTPTPRIAALAESNASVGLMVKALSNFQYRTLDVKSDYKPGGDLILQVRLEGHNPDWQSGRPVNLNLNLQENIPVLLKSLQVGDEISEKLRKRYNNVP